MTILIIGGTGKLGFSVAKVLQETMRQPVLITSRRKKSESPPSSSSSSPFRNFHIVQFDWHDKSTFINPFKYIVISSYQKEELIEPTKKLSPIDRVLLIIPISIDMLDYMKPFIRIAIDQGVKRFVLVSATPAKKGELGLGRVHEYIENLGMDWCVLRPSWFMENFAINYRAVIRDYDCIPSVSEDGKVSFVSINDVIPVACKALMVKESLNREQIIVGPELLTYDQVANVFSRILDRPITHKRETVIEHVKLYKMVGLGEADAELLTRYDTGVARGSDEAVFAEKSKISGKRTLEEFVRSNKWLWEKQKKGIK